MTQKLIQNFALGSIGDHPAGLLLDGAGDRDGQFVFTFDLNGHRFAQEFDGELGAALPQAKKPVYLAGLWTSAGSPEIRADTAHAAKGFASVAPFGSAFVFDGQHGLVLSIPGVRERFFVSLSGSDLDIDEDEQIVWFTEWEIGLLDDGDFISRAHHGVPGHAPSD